MKIPHFPRLMALSFGIFFGFAIAALAGPPYSGKVSDLDAGGGYLTVTSAADQTTQTFKVTDQTVIVTSDGKPTELLKLIEGTLVKVDAAPGVGKVASKITVLPAPSQQVP